MPVFINTKEEYQEAVKRGFEPLLDMRFKMDVRLRVEIQTELFGRGRIDTMRANEKFFRWVWNHKPHYCEETMKPLKTYSAVYCSHILTRGAFPEMATDPRNINLLCPEMHNRWENGDRERMRIYWKNKEIINLLKEEYNELK